MHTSSRPLNLAVLAFLAVATLGALWGGPPLGDHEAIVAECARNMRVTGDWLVPWFLDTPFMRKPPLPYWLVAASSYAFPNDPATGLPVTTLVARLPSALAGLGTVLLLWRMGSAMFSRRVGRIAAVISASSVVFLLYSPNATVEMILTFCCTWAGFHFWMAVTTRRTSPRLLHLFMYYLALGLAMLAKGPAPLAMVAVPLAVWWYTDRPLRLLAVGTRSAARYAPIAFLRGLKTQTIRAFTRLWLIPGLVVFALCFVPWMMAVAARYPHAWELWNWQYLQRAQGDYLDSRDHGVFYYVPLIFGLTVPWLFLLPEALVGPWLKRYARHRRAMFYCGIWALVGVAIMSVEAFKKPYYIVPAIPPLVLMMAVVADRFYAKRPPSALLAWLTWGAAAVAMLVGLLVGHRQVQRIEPAAAIEVLLVASVTAIVLLLAGVAYIRGRGWVALGVTAAAAVGAFHGVWYASGSDVAGIEKVAELDQELDEAGVPADTEVQWADMRPDGRLTFYFGRRSGYMIDPSEIVTVMVDRSQAKDRLMQMARRRAGDLLASPEPVYLILQGEHYELMRSELGPRAYVLDSIHSPDDMPGKDWVILSNVDPSRRVACKNGTSRDARVDSTT